MTKGPRDAGTPRGISAEQRDALWKWRWLGWRDSTPAFKACLALLAAIAFALGTYVAVGAGR